MSAHVLFRGVFSIHRGAQKKTFFFLGVGEFSQKKEGFFFRNILDSTLANTLRTERSHNLEFISRKRENVQETLK